MECGIKGLDAKRLELVLNTALNIDKHSDRTNFGQVASCELMSIVVL